ncbi:MAG: hypothetical protein ABGZ35_23185 [Planctomycetaceae bacterium]
MTLYSLCASVLAVGLTFSGPMAVGAEQAAGVKYLTDLSRCEPQAALALKARQGCWQLVPYETVEPGPKGGTMICAASFINAPDVTLPLNVTGWHDVYVGFWNPHFVYDGGTTVKVKLSDDPCFTRISEREPVADLHGTHIKESLVITADLTGRSLQFGQVHGPFAQKAYIAYVKLVPLTDQRVADLQADRARKKTRVLQAEIDGLTYFWSNEYQTRAQIMELIEPYRYSDVGKVIWAVAYGDLTNYPTGVGTYWARERDVPVTAASNSYVAGEKAAYESLRSLSGKGIIPQAVAAEHAHAMGLKFDAMFRLSMLGSIPLTRGGGSFVSNHPQFCKVTQDGTTIQSGSYAFPEVRKLVISIIRETAESLDIDGVNLCFIRGPEFMAYEQPVLDDFRREYNEDGRKVGFDDRRMRTIRCRYLNAFVGDVRKTLDEVGKRKGRTLELSAGIFGDPGKNLNHGVDAKHWIEQGWLDSVISHAGPLNPELIATAKAHDCQYIFAAIASTGSDYAKGWHYSRDSLGVDGFAIWDIDTVQDSPTLWPVLSRAGHRKEIEAASKADPAPLKTIRVKTIGGIDVLQGLWGAVYSGG